jgi:hypothetical protein
METKHVEYGTCCECECEEELHSLGGNWYCGKCIGKICTNCGNYSNNLILTEDGGKYCGECAGEKGFDFIKESYYKPTPNFLTDKKRDKIFMGFELEVEEKNKDGGLLAFKLMQFLKKNKLDTFFYLKKDGSLSNGVEIVTHPFTLKFLKDYMKVKELLQLLKLEGGTIDSGNCGFHIHISKRIFKDYDITKMRLFFSLYQEKLFTFSQREYMDNEYCQYENITDYNNFDDFLTVNERDKYRALNYGDNPRTIELRLFNSTLNYERLISYMEFAKAISLFCKKESLLSFVRSAKTQSDDIWNSFICFLKYQNKYKSLLKILKKDGLI